MTEVGNTYQLEPTQDERFYPSRAKAIIEQIFTSKLKMPNTMLPKAHKSLKTQQGQSEPGQKVNISKKEELRMQRYKIGVQVVFGELKGHGLRVASKSLWDPNYDNWVEYTFSNENIFCTGLVFAMYFE